MTIWKDYLTMMDPTDTIVIDDVDSLNADLFARLLRDHHGRSRSSSGAGQQQRSDDDVAAVDVVVVPKIESLAFERVEEGVLSQVYRVHLTFQDNSSNSNSNSTTAVDGPLLLLLPPPPSDWVVKLVRKDLNLQWMCKNETTFYSRYAASFLDVHCPGSSCDISHNSRNEPSRPSDASPTPSPLPFVIPTFLSGSDTHLIVQEVLDVRTYPLAGGCPLSLLEFLIRSLATLHARGWEAPCFVVDDDVSRIGEDDDNNNNNNNNNDDGLAYPAGMGQRLPPLQKEGLFVTSWRETVHRTFFDDDDDDDGGGDGTTTDDDDDNDGLEEFTTSLCSRLEGLRLRDVHDRVHRHRVTCVHGDYHIANWLFPRGGTTAAAAGGKVMFGLDDENDENNDANNDDTSGSSKRQPTNARPVLVDWATTGYGNPMVDLVFCLVVSTNDDVARQAFQVWLPRYYNMLMKGMEGRRDNTPTEELTLETMKEWFQWALLCQWLILVAYDGVCRNIASSEPDGERREVQQRHFRNVNRRAMLAMQSVGNWDVILSELAPTTEAERLEAQQFCETSPLEI